MILCDVVIIGLQLRSILKCEINLHNSSPACSEQNSLSGHYQVSSRLPANLLRLL